jgi:hypothetical protein
VERSRARRGLWAVLLVAAGCNSDPVAPVQAACRSGLQPIMLSVGADSAIDPESSGCILISANASSTDSAEYLIVPQASTTSPDFHSSFKLAGGAAIGAAPPVAALLQAAPPSPAQQFHDRLRLMEQNGAYPVPAGLQGSTGIAAPSVLGAGPSDTVGNPRTFKVLSNLTNPTIFTSVNATAKSVGTHIILYVDNLAPPDGLSLADYDKLRSDFDTLLYAVDTTAFGRESDLDGNGRVIVLMSNVINRLVTAQECVSTGYVSGFFFAGDLAPGTRAMWNNGEVFYTVVADSSATLSCAHSNSQVNRVVPVTFIHEFQHMISFNQHVLLRPGGAGEMLWLNEGMSHYAEELGGRVFLQAGDNTRFCDHVRGDLYNFGLYLENPGASGLVITNGIGTLSERGAWWAFVRYLVDQFAADTGLAAAAVFTKLIDGTSATGTDNIAQRTGVPFATLARRWVLANWVSDLPGFTAPTVLKYKHWAFRSDYPALHASCTSWSAFQRLPPDAFPLQAPGGPGAAINVSGTIYAGSAGTYQRALQGPNGAQFTLLFSDGTGALLQGSLLPRLNVLRIR